MGAWQEIVDYTVPSNTTSVVLDSFGTITKDDFVKVVMTHVNPTASNSFVGVFPNSNTTTTNYHSQYLEGFGTSIGVNRVNNNRFNVVTANNNATHIGYIKLSENNKYNSFSNSTIRNASDLHVLFYYATQSGGADTTSITSLTFTSSVTNAIGTGSRIQIYKLAATKVADITVGSNTTQVDISNLSIDKDSEYLLVSEVINNSSLGSHIYMPINDATTLSGYYRQSIEGVGSTASTRRDNQPRIGSNSGGGGQRDVIYTHIKLSNIGAYTAQSYELRTVGTSSVSIENSFVSSTSEAITSITKLNVIHERGSGIAAGSRFQLYKLY